MTRTSTWYVLAALTGALGPVGWFFLLAEPVSQATDALTALVLLPVLMAVMLLAAALVTPGVKARHRLLGVVLATAGLAAWVAYALSRPWRPAYLTASRRGAASRQLDRSRASTRGQSASSARLTPIQPEGPM